MNHFILATSRMCKVLAEGIKQPEMYVYMMNECFNMKGLPNIPIPHVVMATAKNIYMKKMPHNQVPNQLSHPVNTALSTMYPTIQTS